MKIRTERLVDTRDAGSERLRTALHELRGELPSETELRGVFARLRAELKEQPSESGVHRIPRPPHLRLVTPNAAEAQSDGQPGKRAASPVARWYQHTTAWTAAAVVLAASVLLLVEGAGRLRSAAPRAGAERKPVATSPGYGVRSVPDEIRNGLAMPPEVPPVAPLPVVRVPAPPLAPAPVPARPAVPPSRVAQAPRSEEEAPVATVNFNSIPIAAVLLDGRPLGGTPRLNVPVSPGEHRVVFIHPEHGRRYRTINVDEGRTVVAAVRFQ